MRWNLSALSRWNPERSRFALFAALQTILSLIVALLTALIDPLFLNHTPQGIELAVYNGLMGGKATEAVSINREMTSLLFFIGAILLIVGGLIYTGRTDRGHKWTKTMGAFLLTALLSLFALLVLSGVVPSFGYSLLYLWRFTGGIFYLMIFWDYASRYFDSRSSKKYYPHLAMAGTLTYSLGSFLGASGPLLGNPERSLLLILLLSLAGMVLNFFISRRLRPSTAVRYRRNSLYRECTEGLRFFSSHPYLKAMGIATVIFGLTSGVVMYSYNQLVTTLPAITVGSGRLMALQRAVASMAQTAIFALLMKQGKTGRGILTQVLTKVFFLVIGVLGFLVSILGVADFSRAVSTALMSPITMSSFALIPSAYRGRAMSLNNMVLSAGGILLSSILIFTGTLLGWPVKIYALIIIFLLISRIAMNFLLNKGYMRSLAREIREKKSSAISDDQLKKALDDPALLTSWMTGASDLGEREKQIIWARIVRFATHRRHWEYLKPWVPEAGSPVEIAWIDICGQCAPEDNRVFLKNHSCLTSDSGRAAWRHLIHAGFMSDEERSSLHYDVEIAAQIWMEYPDSHSEELRFLSELFPDLLMNNLKNSFQKTENEEDMINIIEILKGVTNQSVENFLMENIKPETIRSTLELLDGRKDLDPETIKGIYNQDQYRNFRPGLMKISLRQKDPGFQKWTRQILQDSLKDFQSESPEDAFRHWFSFRESGQRDSVSFLLRQALTHSPLHKGLDPAHLWSLSSLFYSFSAAFFVWGWNGEPEESYPDLVRKALLEEYRKAREFSLLCLLLSRAGSNIRALVAPSLEERELDIHAVLILELLENVLSGKELRSISLLLEPLSDARRVAKLQNSLPALSRIRVLKIWAEENCDERSMTGRILSQLK